MTSQNLLRIDRITKSFTVANQHVAAQGELQRIWAQEKIAMVLVTHDVDEALFLADRVVVLAPNPGRIAAIVDVALPRSRDRLAPACIALKAQILSQLDHFAEAA